VSLSLGVLPKVGETRNLSKLIRVDKRAMDFGAKLYITLW
jgi:hypothetical protein